MKDLINSFGSLYLLLGNSDDALALVYADIFLRGGKKEHFIENVQENKGFTNFQAPPYV